MDAVTGEGKKDPAHDRSRSRAPSKSKELHKRVVRKFPRRQVFVSGVNDTWGMDLVDMQKYAKENKGFKYLLTVIDVLSKFAWVVAIKDKKYHTIVNAIQEVLQAAARDAAHDRKAIASDRGRTAPKHIWCDQGSEFLNKQVTKFIKPINVYHTFSEHKSAVIERFNRTLKTRLYYKLHKHKTTKWLDYLPKIVREYNHTIHHTTGMKPYKAIKKEAELLEQQEYRIKKYGEKFSDKPKFQLGDVVRLSKTKGVFEKGYEPNWSKELFKINGIIYSKPIMYSVEDASGEKVIGSFYAQELQKSEFPMKIQAERESSRSQSDREQHK